MEYLLALSGIIAGLAIALWQNRRAGRAERRLNNMLVELPSQMARELTSIGSAFGAATGGTPSAELPRQGGGIFATSHADVDHDGRDELLVQYPAGAHGSVLQVFGWRDFEFKQIGGLSVGTPAGFNVEDFDADGRLEISTDETDWSLDLSYAVSPRVRIWYRWNGEKFVEVGSRKLYTDEEAKRLLREFGPK